MQLLLRLKAPQLAVGLEVEGDRVGVHNHHILENLRGADTERTFLVEYPLHE